MPSARILVFAGSIRTEALSQKLANAAAKEIALRDADVTTISLADYPLPIYNGDLENEKGIPENAMKLARLLVAHQGVFVSTPEYNHGLPPLLTNMLAWVSRNKHTGSLPYRHKVYAIGSSSDGRFGGARATIQLRTQLASALGGIVIPARIEVPMAQDAFDETGALIDEINVKMLQMTCRQLVDFAARLAD